MASAQAKYVGYTILKFLTGAISALGLLGAIGIIAFSLVDIVLLAAYMAPKFGGLDQSVFDVSQTARASFAMAIFALFVNAVAGFCAADEEWKMSFFFYFISAIAIGIPAGLLHKAHIDAGCRTHSEGVAICTQWLAIDVVNFVFLAMAILMCVAVICLSLAEEYDYVFGSKAREFRELAKKERAKAKEAKEKKAEETDKTAQVGQTEPAVLAGETAAPATKTE